MAGIIIFIILAVGYALCGDTSGVEAIGKGILYIALFIGVGCIIVYAPWLILVIIVGAVIWAVISSRGNSSHSKNDYTINDNSINSWRQNNEVSPTIDYSNQSDFQRQLQENTKTLQQVENGSWLKEKEQIALIAKNDFTDIKRKLLDKAKNGQYCTVNGYKNITIDYSCLYLMNCIHREHYYNPTGKMGTSSYRTNKKVSYAVNKKKQYDFYLSTIKEFSSEDNISINVFFVELDPVVYQKENIISLPYTYKHEWRTDSHKIKAYLKCSIQY